MEFRWYLFNQHLLNNSIVISEYFYNFCIFQVFLLCFWVKPPWIIYIPSSFQNPNIKNPFLSKLSLKLSIELFPLINIFYLNILTYSHRYFLFYIQYQPQFIHYFCIFQYCSIKIIHYYSWIYTHLCLNLLKDQRNYY